MTTNAKITVDEKGIAHFLIPGEKDLNIVTMDHCKYHPNECFKHNGSVNTILGRLFGVKRKDSDYSGSGWGVVKDNIAVIGKTQMLIEKPLVTKIVENNKYKTEGGQNMENIQVVLTPGTPIRFEEFDDFWYDDVDIVCKIQTGNYYHDLNCNGEFKLHESNVIDKRVF